MRYLKTLVLNSAFTLSLILLAVGLYARTAFADSEVTVVKIGHVAGTELMNGRFFCLGLALGAAALLVGILLWNSALLKTSVCLSHLFFVITAAGALSYVVVQELIRAYAENVSLYFAWIIRLQLVLSAVMMFTLLKNSQNKQKIGSFFSALLGGVLGATALEILWPVDILVLLSQGVLMMASVFFGLKQFHASSSKPLFFHLLIAGATAYISLFLPDLKKVTGDAYSVFALLELSMLVCVAASLWSTLEDLHTDKFGRLKREIYGVELRLQKSQQLVGMLENDRQILTHKLQEETKIHHQVELRDTLKIKALEEMSQDIAQGMMGYLRELDYGCQQIIVECKSQKARMPRVRAYAERASLLATKVKEVMGFLQRKEEGGTPQLVNASDLLKECLRICHDKIQRNGVELEIETYEKDLWLEGHLTLLAQGFLGLLYNALEATESADVRRVTLHLKRVQDQGTDWVEFAVSNSGSGIPTAIKAKVFHSKKRDGLGSHSLGLSMAFGIFESFGGSLNLDNDAVATTFVARLPLYQKDDDHSLRLVS